MRNISDIILETIKTHVVCAMTFSENRAFNEIMWKNFVDPDRPETMSMRNSCWTAVSTDTNSSYEIAIVFPQQQCSHEHS